MQQMRNRPSGQGSARWVGVAIARPTGDYVVSEVTKSRQSRLRICLVGSGAIARRVVELLSALSTSSIELVAIAVPRGLERQSWWPKETVLVSDPNDLATLETDIVLEVASREAVSEWGFHALKAARKFVVCSASALTDDHLRSSLEDAARGFGSQLILAHGALGGLHALSAASTLELHEVVHSIRKHPDAWKGTPAEAITDLSSLEEALTIYEGGARDAASSFPANANAVVISSLAGVGLDRTTVRLVADPSARRNIHSIRATGVFGKLDLTIENEPMQTNPKTSEMTALSLVRLLESEMSSLVV